MLPIPPEPYLVNGAPRNPDVARERTDVDTRAVLWFVGGLGVSLVVVMLALWAMFTLLFDQEKAAKKSRLPLAVEQREGQSPEQRLPPAPRLEGVVPSGQDIEVGRILTNVARTEHSVGRVRPGAAEDLYRPQELRLSTYGWVEPEKVAHIPIEAAIKRLAGKLPARKDGKPGDERSGQPGQTSSGRVPQGGRP
jgi:hypothetical protein